MSESKMKDGINGREKKRDNSSKKNFFTSNYKNIFSIDNICCLRLCFLLLLEAATIVSSVEWGEAVGKINSLKSPYNINKASLKSTTNSDQFLPRSLAPDKKKPYYFIF